MGKKVTKDRQAAQAAQKSQRRLRALLGAALLVVGIGAVVGGVLAFRHEQQKDAAAPDTANYETVLKKYYSAILAADGQRMSQVMAPPEYWTYYMETYSKTEEDVIKSFQEGCNTTLDEWKENYGADVKVSYKIAGLSEPAQEGLDEWNTNMESMLGNDGAKITDAVVLSVEETFSGSQSSGKEIIYPTLGKIGDSWYIIEEDNDELKGTAATEAT